MVLKRVGIGSAAKLAGAIYASLGLIIGAVVALVSVVGAGLTAAASQSEVPAWIGAVFGITAIVWMPLVYGVMGLVVGALSAALYNLFSQPLLVRLSQQAPIGCGMRLGAFQGRGMSTAPRICL